MTGQDGFEFPNYIWILFGDVLPLYWPFAIVVKFDSLIAVCLSWIFPNDESITVRTDGTAEAFFLKTVIGMIVHAGLGILKYGSETHSINRLWTDGLGQPGELGKSGINVNCFGYLAGG